MIFNSDTNLIKQFILQRKFRTFWIILLGIITNLFTIIIPVSIGKYYQLVFDFKSYRLKSLSVIPSNIWDTVPKFLIVFFILIVIRYLFYFLHEYYLRGEGEIFIKNIKDYLFKHQLQIHNAVYKEKGVGKYLLRYSGDINSLKNLYLKGTVRAIVDFVMILFALSWLYTLNEKGAIAIIVLSMLFYIIIRFLNKKVETYSFQKRNRTSGQLSFVSRTLNSIVSVILHNKQPVELKKYMKKSDAVMKSAFEFNKWSVINRGFVFFIQYVILGVVLYVFYLDTKSNTLNHESELISFILLYITILPVIRRLFSLERVYKLGNISLNKLNNILEIESENITIGEKLTINKPRVVFEDVKFDRFETINFKSKKMGYSSLKLPIGVEESDIISALSRLYNEYEGIIKINNCDIKEYSPKSLRSSISFCSKKIPLVGRTVYEVITEYRSNKIKEEAKNVLSEIQSVFYNIPSLELDERIGENGSQLSNGQYEVLCLARGILSKNKIIIVGFFPILSRYNLEAFLDVLKMNEATIIKIKA